jgi:molybdate transport system substrate-binding protein
LATPLSTTPLLNFSGLLSTCLAVVFVFLPLVAQAELLVAAAADLAPVEAPLAQAFQRAGGTRFRFVLGSSGMLGRQIERGAPYDVYLSADERIVSNLAASGRLLKETVRTYAHGRLGLWSRNRKFSGLEQLRDKSLRHIAIPNPVHAPYGVAAKQALENQGLWRELEPRIVYGENVRQALQFAESGNADAVITSWSLVFDRGALPLPDSLHAPIRQSGGVVASTKQAAEARAFMNFLVGSEGRAILSSRGLVVTP